MCLEVILESARKRNKKGPNLPARFISTRMYIWRSFYRAHENATKKAQICRPDLFPRTCIFRCLYAKFLWQFLLISLLCSLCAWIIQIKIFFEFLWTYHALEAWEHSQACFVKKPLYVLSTCMAKCQLKIPPSNFMTLLCIKNYVHPVILNWSQE